MNDLTILHLSDLHFDNTGAQPFKLYDALLNDVEVQLKYSKNVVVVVTGDIIDQAKYRCKDLAVHFFQKLKTVVDTLGIDIKGIYFVPGNHDKERSHATEMLSRITGPFDKDYFDDFGKFFRKSFKNYTSLTKEIFHIFFPNDSEDFSESTYGCNQLTIDDQPYIFVRFNTAWSATGDADRRNLNLGSFQLQEIEKEFRDITLDQQNNSSAQKKPVVIAMAHHPLNWLTGQEEDSIQNFLIGQRGIDAQIFLCGHTHTRDVINWSNNRQSLTTLSTGIGWPDEPSSDHSELHAYSVYVLHLDLNAIDIYVRSTNDGGTFVEDYRLYTKEENKKHNKIVLPLSSTKVHSYFELGAVTGRSPKVIFLSNDFLMKSQQFIESLGSFRQMAIQEIHFRKARPVTNKAKKYLYFKSYMQLLCDGFAIHFLDDKAASEDPCIRFHFRCISFDEGGVATYPQLCSSYWPVSKEKQHKTLRVFKFEELIKAVFLEKRPLIFSANPEVCTTPTDWKDFITAIPTCDENIFKLEESEERGVHNYPIITFGASISSSKYEFLLYCLDYYRIDKILGELLHLYAKELSFDILQFSKELAEIDTNDLPTEINTNDSSTEMTL